MSRFRYALNTSTLAPFKLDVLEQITVAAQAGFEGIELWVRDIELYLAQGNSIDKLKGHLRTSGVEFINAIAFFKWADYDLGVRSKAFEQAAKEMEMMASLGCKAIAAPPFGDVTKVNLEDMAASFSKLVNLGRGLGIEPILEFWGRSPKLSRLSEALYVLMESGVSQGKVLMDLFHMYTGGTSLSGIGCMSGSSIGLVHVNDYPDVPSREVITDADRVFPGDGVAPTSEFATLLTSSGYRGYLSLELFIKDYGDLSALDIARKGIDKVITAYKRDGE